MLRYFIKDTYAKRRWVVETCNPDDAIEYARKLGISECIVGPTKDQDELIMDLLETPMTKNITGAKRIY